jgi:hypothetical protein
MNGPVVKVNSFKELKQALAPRKKVHRLTHDERCQVVREIGESNRSSEALQEIGARWDLSTTYLMNLRTQFFGRPTFRSSQTTALSTLDADNRRLRDENDKLRNKVKTLMEMIDRERLLEMVLKD